MSNIFKFENLECWQKAENLAVDIYKISMEGKLGMDFGLRDQIRKSVISIVSNIAEGKERETPAELIRFLFFAKGSAGELRAQLSIAKRIGFLKDEDFQRLKTKTIKISIMINSLIKAIKNKK